VFVGYSNQGSGALRKTIVKGLAKVLGPDGRELFHQVHSGAQTILNLSRDSPVLSAGKRFKKDHLFRRFRDISDAEMEMLSHVPSLDEVRSAREFISILNAVPIAIHPVEHRGGSAWAQFKDDDLLRHSKAYLTQRWECFHTLHR